jgi:hypothetical protein
MLIFKADELMIDFEKLCLASALLIISSSSFAVDRWKANEMQAKACSKQALKGTYLFIAPSSNDVQSSYIGILSYDGNGAVKVKKTLNVNGQWINQISEGIYSVNADCSGSANYPTAQFS